MPGFILTGAPGSGKTAILRHLEVDGHPVVEEAATDVIALHQALGRPEPWREPDFAEQVLDLQRRRRRRAEMFGGDVVFHDRSPVCTLALCRHLGLTPPPALFDEIERMTAERTVFFVRNQGFVEATAARRISFEESLVFERVHELTYRDAGFDLVEVPAGPLTTRVAAIKQAVDRLRAARVRT
ncbi:AAA family ATPase [Micromonospora aurantiaca (nom. illeg.)]|uniref:AAA family ATPase n=1 Tax=Micromonospora aurantiaca (nom. illeg.) TaxID=47850 RepID=UPI0036CDEFBC